MSLLIKTIEFYIPNWKECCFVCESWFLEDYTLQINVLHLCKNGYADKIKYFGITRDDFKYNINYLITQYYEKNENENESDKKKFLENLLKDISIGMSLLNEGWFYHSNHLHVIMFIIKMYGYKDYINDIDNLEQNLDDIVKIIMGK
jgi:hypothetical protein